MGLLLSTNKTIRDTLNDMNANVLTVDDAARCLPELVDRVHASGEPALLIKSGKPVARIVSIAHHAGSTKDLIAFLRRWRLKHPEADEQFGEAIAESRRSLASQFSESRGYLIFNFHLLSASVFPFFTKNSSVSAVW